MSQTSPRLALPFIQSAQAQKHVTHNEAVELLDALVQLTSEDIDVTAPQTATAEGQAWGIGAGSGLWAGHAGQIATWRGGGWLYLTPQAGWRAWIAARGQLRVWDGGTWVLPQAATPDFNNLPGLGVNASSDATNRLAVSSDAVLFNHAGAGHQLKLNKASTGDTASLLFQSDWQGRAELGLAGSDNFSVKVSDGGGSFTESLVIDAGSGAVRFPAGLAGSGSVAGALGLQAMAFTCERNTGFTTGSYLGPSERGLGSGRGCHALRRARAGCHAVATQPRCGHQHGADDRQPDGSTATRGDDPRDRRRCRNGHRGLQNKLPALRGGRRIGAQSDGQFGQKRGQRGHVLCGLRLT